MVCLVLMCSCLLAVKVTMLAASSETMKNISLNLLRALTECREELGLTENIMLDLYMFWKEDQALISRDIGCAIVCMSKKLNLLNEDGKFHHGNAKEFAMTHGAEEETAAKLVSIVHECEAQHEDSDECVRALGIAKCFKIGIQELKWVPSMNVIVTEVLTEV